jgi:hypothetical protein
MLSYAPKMMVRINLEVRNFLRLVTGMHMTVVFRDVFLISEKTNFYCRSEPFFYMEKTKEQD